MTGVEGRSVIVSGAGRGIGRGIADAFAQAGACVIGCGRGQRPDDLQTDIEWATADVSQLTDVNKLFERALAQHGTLDILINNAGIQIEKTLDCTSDDDWQDLMGVNMQGVFLMSRAFIRSQRKSGNSGNIINIGSVSGETADPGLAIYNASKAFVHGLTRSIAVDHGRHGIRCNAISPGWIITGMADAAFASASSPSVAKQDALSRHPVGRFGQPADIAAAALWLASNQSDFMTGQCIKVDGGLMSGSPISPHLF